MSTIWSQTIISRSFEGAKRSKEFILERLLEQTIGTAPDVALLDTDVRRLKNFIGIIDASYRLDTLKEGIHLVYQVREGSSRFPVVQLGGLEGNFWWELGYMDQNWRGRGESIGLSIRQTDGRLGGRAFYSKPSFSGSRWGYGLQLERYASQEPLYFGDETVEYFYENQNIGSQVFYHFRPEARLQLGLTYFVENYNKVNREQLIGPQARREVKQLAYLSYQLREINPDLFQPRGYYWQLEGTLVFQKEETPFYLFRFIGARYYPVGVNGLFASKLTLGYSANKNTPFAPFVVDSRLNIRGSGNRVDRGTAAVILNAEYRHVLFKKSWLAVQGVAFIDMGSWRNPGGEIQDLTSWENTKYFTGLGLRLISDRAGQFVLRMDYGYGLHPVGRQGIVLGLGQYF
ncbi:MAG: BamA/TamA family outer membrane protein [Saprospiraceae bacterium]|nr:BamA/TamA family outer membrane protein [Saprospiraceae bacterium]MDZ4705390.1 BamA/TamA family outer membrane protein [Saprospiraceae bacterium]